MADDANVQAIHEKRLRRILDVAILNNVAVIILGACGCGAFGNNPDIVAKAALKVLPEYINKFATIEYAIYCPPGNDKNYQVFKHILSELQEKYKA